MKSSHKMLLTIIIGSAVFIGGFFYYHYDAPALQYDNTAIPDTQISSSMLDGFVVTQLENGDRNVASSDGTYSVTVSSSIYSSVDNGRLVLQDYPETNEGVGGPQGCQTFIVEDDRSVDSILKNKIENCRQDTECTSIKHQDFKIGEMDWTEVWSEGAYVGSGNKSFMINKENKTFVVSFICDKGGYEKQILQNIHF